VHMIRFENSPTKESPTVWINTRRTRATVAASSRCNRLPKHVAVTAVSETDSASVQSVVAAMARIIHVSKMCTILQPMGVDK